MAEKKFTLIGRVVTDQEAEAIPATARFSNKQTKQWIAQRPEELIQDEVFHHHDRLSILLMTTVKVQCPVGPHDDAGLETAVLRACSISPVKTVIVQCTQGHWGEYPCG